MENLLTFCVACVHSDAGGRCFYLIQGHLALLRLGWHLLVISFFMERCITVELRVVSPLFLAQMTPHSQKRNMLSLSPLFLSLSVTHWQHVHTDCISSVNDSVNVPHQRMSHSTTLLLWWFLPSVYYIMQQRVLLSYIRHNKHSLSALI